MVVIDLTVRDDVVGATELRLGMLCGISAEKEDPAYHGFRVANRLERLVKMDFYLLGLAEADENWIALVFVVGECSQRTLHTQGVRREA